MSFFIALLNAGGYWAGVLGLPGGESAYLAFSGLLLGVVVVFLRRNLWGSLAVMYGIGWLVVQSVTGLVKSVKEIAARAGTAVQAAPAGQGVESAHTGQVLGIIFFLVCTVAGVFLFKRVSSLRAPAPGGERTTEVLARVLMVPGKLAKWSRAVARVLRRWSGRKNS
jgi:uncharacterized membrane protein